MSESAVFDIFVDTLVRLIENENVEFTVEMLNRHVTNLSNIPPFNELAPDDVERVGRKVLARVQVVMGAATIVVDKEWTPWVNRRRHEIDDFYWARYISFLDRRRGVPRNVRAELDRSTLQVLDMTYDPTASGSWDRRGLVMGNVQSGKTQHYIGLIAKAADAGYKIIIVIAGVHNNLRNQTQERLDESFVGRRWSGIPGSRHEDVGVSLLGGSTATRRPASFTGATKDFNKSSAQSLNVPLASLKEPAVFVVKKNSRTLRELIDWLRGWNLGRDGTIHEPLLLIDDEADNASIDVGRSSEISEINKKIRELLSLFDKSSYVGYTATPFANIFIDPRSEDAMVREDLFPRSFIIDLDPPSNYLGPQRVFLESPHDFLRDVTDNEAFLPVSHKIDWEIDELPLSLVRAVHCFLLSRSIRILRRDGMQHSSMMINASRFNAVQEQIQLLVSEEVERVRNAVRSYAGLGDRAVEESSELKAISDVFGEEYAGSGVSWPQVLAVLNSAISPVEVVLVNMKRKQDPLQYERYRQEGQGRHVIAVGGLSLSRGLTLEGLTVSYFLRNSKMYDTLLQMGRWFGYRSNYEDLVRIWMPRESSDWYEHITEAVEELRSELRSMSDSGHSPVDFGLKVRRHPDSLLITARNKFGRFGDVTLSTSFSNRLVETVRIRTDEIAENLETMRWLEQRLVLSGVPIMPKEGRLEVFGVGCDLVVEFLSRFRNFESAKSSLASELVLRYIESMKDHVPMWNVAIPSPSSEGQKGVARREVGFAGYTLLSQQRTPNRVRRLGQDFAFFVTAKQRVSSRGIEAFCLDDAVVEKVRRENPQRNIPDIRFREERETPLLMLHYITAIPPDDRSESHGNELIAHLEETGGIYAAWGISFPDFKERDCGIEARYHVNATWMENEFGSLNDIEEEENEVE
jgi:hypothetical protein